MAYIGIDIGGTKCAVVRGIGTDIEAKVRFETADCDSTLSRIFTEVNALMTDRIEAIGVSCGGPLDARRGVIMSPPNLPGWDDVHITEMLNERFNLPAYLCNDADACAVAEWRYGAGIGARNMAFLTFGTGLGAGLILDNKLYTGACGMAGELAVLPNMVRAVLGSLPSVRQRGSPKPWQYTKRWARILEKRLPSSLIY